MARDDEFRKVAEDIGALARSLGRDFREAVDQAIRGGHSPGRAVRHGLRDMRDEARRGLRDNWSGYPGYGSYRRRGGRPWAPWGWGCGPGSNSSPGYWGRNAWAPPPPPPGAAQPGPSDDPASEPGGPGGPWAPAGPGWDRRRPAGPGSNRGRATGPPRSSPRSRRSPLPPVRHRWDATTVLGLLAVLFGVAWLIGATGALHLSIEGVVAVGLMLLGAALVVTGRTDWSLSRRSWPVWLGAALIVVLIATSSTFGLGGALNSVSFGNKNLTATPGSTVHGGFGNLTVTLPSITHDSTVKVASVAGRIIVDPANGPAYNVKVKSRVFAGQICVNGLNAADGVGASNQQTIYTGPQSSPPPPASAPTLTLDVHQMFGQILINGQGCARR